ncbi:putative PTS IIA-like nitrogen-regulatory protein PtsN [Candidatus Vecturithrix granuli]|uniref:Putative PTS IIA-like nitrogen-regulatory protein PtsN n=1 Tax=Vecturithrix granuli TaxID=1499967 RepID=A0A081BUC4_VECG1|nr:putative PTS IIA-like nitrogen-regulatory protein PtsN [Candidatus Vecturithrix granuli]
MEICKVLSLDRIVVGVKNRDKIGILQELLEVAATSGKIHNKEELLKSLLQREQIQTTGVGFGLAIAHAKSDDVEGVVLSVGLSEEGVDYDALDGKPAHIIFMLVSSPEKNTEYLSVLAKIARIFREEDFREAVMHAGSPEKVMNLLKEREEGHSRC